jgi:hypothetical protein
MCEAVAPPTHVQKKEDTMMKEKWFSEILFINTFPLKPIQA